MRPCPACNSNSRHSRGEKNGLALARCDSCGTLYVSQQLSPQELRALYDVYYEDALLSCPEFLASRLDELVASMEGSRQSNRWLDVGFGAGLLMEAAARGGWNVVGTEVAPPAYEQMKEKGYDVHRGELAECGLPPESFDVVSMVEVLEHLIDPGAVLTDAGKLLRPGGTLYLTTPNVDSLAHRALRNRWSVVTPPHHLELFSLTGARRLLEAKGFAIVGVERVGLNPNEFRSLAPSARSSISQQDRVESAYRLNEAMMSSRSRRAAKSALNRTLSVAGLGDTLKIQARRTSRANTSAGAAAIATS